MRAAFLLLEDSLWGRPAAGGLRIGPQVRHVLDFYECFFRGVDCGEIDYDARSRSRVVESSRMAAIHAIQSIVERLEALAVADLGPSIRIRDEDCILHSSIARELNSLLNHTIHHMALIAIALDAFGVPVHPSFGVAPSTLRYRQSTGAAA